MSSFEAIKHYYEEIKNAVDVSRVVFVVVGNKSDLYEKEEVKQNDGKAFAKEINGFFRLTSCLNANGIDVIIIILLISYRKCLRLLDLNY